MISYKTIPVPGYEKIIEAREEKSGLHAFFAIHSTVQGPALGGLRIQHYHNATEALDDVCRLAQGMSYKSAISELPFGGGKSVIYLTPEQRKSEALLRTYAEALNYLQGTYICTVDLGSTLADMEIIRQHSPHILCTTQSYQGFDPSVYTAWGCLCGIQVSALKIWGSTNLTGKKIAIQGLGSVGRKLAQHLYWAGAELIVSDINPTSLAEAKDSLGAKIVPVESYMATKCDILAPCAIGSIINTESIANLQCKIIAGAANNQLLSKNNGQQLSEKKILYAPDYVINAGGLIFCANISLETPFSATACRDQVSAIGERLMSIYQIAEDRAISTDSVADQIAVKRL